MTRNGLSKRLEGTLAEWRRLRPPPADLSERLDRFLNLARPALRQAERHVVPAHARQLTEDRLRAFIQDSRGPIAAAKRRGRSLDLLSIFGLRRSETRNASLLAALWDQRNCGDLAIDFLTAVLSEVPGDGGLPNRVQLERGYVVRTEDCPVGDGEDRIDVVIEGTDFLLGVEIKIDAREGNDQLVRYRRALARRANAIGLDMNLVFLSPRPPADLTERHISWTSIVRAAESVLSSRRDAPTFNGQVLAQFAEHIKSF